MKNLAIVTGASSGIGKAIAIKLSNLGFPLLLISRRKHLLEELNLPNSLCKNVDVTNLSEFSHAVYEAERMFGKTEILINNAGVMLLGKAYKQDITEWNDMIDINIKGVLNGLNCVLQTMKENNIGTIINISSLAGFKTFENHSVYCASKHAIHGLSESLRQELAPYNVRVSLISPGIVETSLLKHTTDKSIKEDYIKMKKVIGGGLESSDIADLVEIIVSKPQNICIREIKIAPTKQEL